MIPPLPTEILHHIIKLSLPVVSFKSFRERYDLLLVYSLVNSTWRALGRKELYEELLVKDSREAAAVLSVEGAREAVKRVHLGCDESLASDELPDVDLGTVELPRSVKELRISGLCVNAEDLPSLGHLEVIHLRWFGLGYAMSSLPALPIPASLPLFSSLSTLSLLDPYLFLQSFPTWTRWFNPTHFPLLRQLSLGFTYSLQELGEDDDFHEAPSFLAPQLTTLSVTQGFSELGNDSDFPWTKFIALCELALFPNYWQPTGLLRAALQSVPGSLSMLRVGDCRDVDKRYQMENAWQEDVLGALATAFAEGSPSL
ncbi:hypothetical protein BCR35DRAFT_305692 [Leucosporidium creatinivorum]|uniref:F-box domain-containing protein n=1 Tax=Leucosporidium creatinivorum TaxID=106004 RepID=A0A1Y2EZ95_9BASI|nr:hypothetical protein BCR35DRAFT_305692 [Leucosporidium creatinivorum]